MPRLWTYSTFGTSDIIIYYHILYVYHFYQYVGQIFASCSFISLKNMNAWDCRTKNKNPTQRCGDQKIAPPSRSYIIYIYIIYILYIILYFSFFLDLLRDLWGDPSGDFWRSLRISRASPRWIPRGI